VVSDDSEPLGGISDNNGETAERAGLSENTKINRQVCRPANIRLLLIIFIVLELLAAIKPTTSVPEFVPPSKSADLVKRKQDIRFKHLPPQIVYSFQNNFSPLICQLFGALRPWGKSLPDEQILKLFSNEFPEHAMFIGSDWGKKVILKLVRVRFLWIVSYFKLFP
jgi:hypothetical protein